MNKKVQFLTSNLLTEAGIKHGWFMRFGGVSTGLFSSLNGKKNNGDSDYNVDLNRVRAIKTLKFSKPHKLAHITHSFKDNILLTNQCGEFINYDASITNSNDVVLSQTTADCGSIIVASADGAVVGLIHTSWHTLKSKIITKAVNKIKTLSSQSLVAGIGPMICLKCYEFGPEASTLFDKKYLIPTNDRYLVDLKSMAIDQLTEAGINRIDDMNVCTYEDQRFFSHRHNGAKSGRFLTLASKAPS